MVYFCSCPPGQTERNPTVATIAIESLKAKSVRIGTPELSIGIIRSYLGDSTPNLQISLEVKGPNGQRVGSRQILGQARVMQNQKVPPQNTDFSDLKPNTRYTADVIGVASRLIAKSCFQTAPDLNIPFGSRPGNSSSGCFPLSIRICKARRRQSGRAYAGPGIVITRQWNRTGDYRSDGDANGYRYILPAADRARLGCDTN